ncbi:hypothetical protein PINS_up002409 [Pythium insidiosum]|nr:hypothetical protein PINS_up002409 [Pythium insidiosum]
MAPKGKAKKARQDSDEHAEPHVANAQAEELPPVETDADENLVFGVSLDSPVDVEDEANVLAPVAKYAILGMICLMSFAIRLFAVVRYESVIHEFDPYFNYRTTKYLATEGFLEFLDWFDDRAWYPLGRIIGGTIYPGLMYTAAMVYWVLNLLNISINVRNTCVFLAPVFAANTAIASYLLTKEVTKRSSAGLMAAAFAGIVPSYISRSVGGSYDNEGVAIFALIFVFYLWIKAVHTGSMFWSASCALAYFYMVAAWGGYVFIINMIPIYVLVMLFAGRYSPRLYIAYSTFYTLGSLLAMQVPFVGFNVVKQAECAGSHGVFVLLQVYCFVNWVRNYVSADSFRRLIIFGAGLVVAAVASVLLVLQLMGKVQWTGRSLTLLDPTYASKYIPIIASVSEHQPTTWTSYFFDLHVLVPFAPVGLYFLFTNLTDGGIFVILYGTVAWYFAGVMVRLMLTLAPIACILGAIGISSTLRKFMGILRRPSSFVLKKNSAQEVPVPLALSVVGGLLILLLSYTFHATYVSSMAYSSPSIVIEAGRTHTGERVNFDDYREAYFWLRQNTDANAKIMSWWDYGYQMSAMANRTVIVDNNTWNNTHIATVGRALASTEEEAYPIMQSLDVDYVLVIFGGVTGYSSDDINKFLWPVRIGSGVFPNDMPSERDFYSAAGGFDVGPGWLQGPPQLPRVQALLLPLRRGHDGLQPSARLRPRAQHGGRREGHQAHAPGGGVHVRALDRAHLQGQEAAERGAHDRAQEGASAGGVCDWQRRVQREDALPRLCHRRRHAGQRPRVQRRRERRQLQPGAASRQGQEQEVLRGRSRRRRGPCVRVQQATDQRGGLRRQRRGLSASVPRLARPLLRLLGRRPGAQPSLGHLRARHQLVELSALKRKRVDFC